MTPRRVTALVALVAVVLLGWGVFSNRWFVAELRSADANGSVRIGLTGISICAATTEARGCERVDWKQVGGDSSASGWMWLGRLTFAVSLAAAVALLILAVMSLAHLDPHRPVDVPRWALRLTLAALPLVGGYYLFAPDALDALFSAGRGFALVIAGAVLGSYAALRERSERWD